MKKILLFSTVVAIGFGLQSCQQPNDGDMTMYQTRIDSTVTVRTTALRDSMMMECNRMVMSAAQAHADSLLALKSGTKKPKSGTTTTKEPEKTGVSNRPGTTGQEQPKVDQRPGTTNDPANQPKVNQRPGVNNPK